MFDIIEAVDVWVGDCFIVVCDPDDRTQATHNTAIRHKAGSNSRGYVVSTLDAATALAAALKAITQEKQLKAQDNQLSLF